MSLSVTSDGGAVALFIKDGDEKETFYASNHQELDELIEHVSGAYTP